MMRLMSPKEVKASEDRVRYLYTTEWLQDNLTAILMDTSRGGSGMNEEIARVKAHGIMNWLEFKKEHLKI